MTVSINRDGQFELYLNESGRDLLVAELQKLDRKWEHFHLDNFGDPAIEFATDVPLSVVPYGEEDKVFKHGKVLLRPDEWDEEYYPHVMKTED
ncbi:hypothetical protein [Henriciella barbarensis]|uniref:hypothetical protein n=1 Tax=Henriciella barbarensis TaxID=86342 RepID=UPI001F417DBF|nr:hypothetical protein [Henriciella barbarensis]